MTINHGYNSIEEYIADINAAIPFIEGYGSASQGASTKSVVNYTINRPTWVLASFHYGVLYYTTYGQKHDRRHENIEDSLISSWFTRGVTYKEHIQTQQESHYRHPLQKYPTKSTNYKEWAELDERALDYIPYTKEFLRFCIEHKLDCTVHELGGSRRINGIKLNSLIPKFQELIKHNAEGERVTGKFGHVRGFTSSLRSYEDKHGLFANVLEALSERKGQEEGAKKWHQFNLQHSR
jgi:hypothetical protein